jgi:hypothetical protein
MGADKRESQSLPWGQKIPHPVPSALHFIKRSAGGRCQGQFLVPPRHLGWRPPLRWDEFFQDQPRRLCSCPEEQTCRHVFGQRSMVLIEFHHDRVLVDNQPPVDEAGRSVHEMLKGETVRQRQRGHRFGFCKGISHSPRQAKCNRARKRSPLVILGEIEWWVARSKNATGVALRLRKSKRRAGRTPARRRRGCEV